MDFRIVLCLVASASALVLDMDKKEGESQTHQAEQQAERIESHATSAAKSMQAQAMNQLSYYMTEEGKKVHEKVVKQEGRSMLQAAAEELEWYSQVARDGMIVDALSGLKFPLLDAKSTEGLLPKGLPEIPKDPTERKHFVEMLPVGEGMYNTMLSLKKNPNSLVEVAKDEFKDALSSLLEVKSSQTEEKQQALTQMQETRQKSIEVIKASPKSFRTALKAWENMVPEAATMLIQTEMAESPQEGKAVFMQAKELANRATALHQVVFDSLEKVHNKDMLMGVAQNRITSLLMRQSEASLADFDSMDGCTAQAKDYSGAEARCLCVVDNICSKAGHSHGGDYCSIVSSATCMSPKNEREVSEMSTV